MATEVTVDASGSLSVYESCVELGMNNTLDMLDCFASAIDDRRSEQLAAVARATQLTNNLYLLFAAALVFFMQTGFAMLCAGAVRRKNVQNTMLKNLLDACGSAVAFFSVGYAFAFGTGSNPNGFIGTTNFFLMGVDDYGFWFYQYTFSAAAATIVAGALAERCKMTAYYLYATLVSGFCYPVVVHVIWSEFGFLSPFHPNPFLGVGVVDFAGGGVVHMTGGVISLIATIVLGPRRGRFHDEETGELLDKPKLFPPSNMGLQVLGVFILWFGWYGFNSGSALVLGSDHVLELAALTAVNTTLAAGCAGLATLCVNLIIMDRINGQAQYDLTFTMNGVLAGLASITAGCGVVEPWAAVIIGFVASFTYLGTSWALVGMRIDDAVDAIPVHFTSGLWGMLAVGLFASPDRLELIYGKSDHIGMFMSVFDRLHDFDASLLGAQCVGILFIIGWNIAVMLPFFLLLDYFDLFRSDYMDEMVGLDKSFHGNTQELGEDTLSPDTVAQIEQRLIKTMKKNRLGGTRVSYSSPSKASKGSGEEHLDDQEQPINEDDY